jgi:hypothetical protein
MFDVGKAKRQQPLKRNLALILLQVRTASFVFGPSCYFFVTEAGIF